MTGGLVSRRWMLFAVLVLGALVAGAASWWWRDEAPMSWRTVEVERTDVRETVSATGTLDAVTTVEVGTQVSGIVAELLVDFNDEVQAGQVIARIDTSLLEADVRSARASLTQAVAEAAQSARNRLDLEGLAGSGAVTASELLAAVTADDVAHARVGSARIALERAERNLAYATITSPIDGVVVVRDVDVGQTVNAGMSAPRLFLIAGDLTRMRILAAVDEADIGRIREGQDVRFTVQAFPDDTFTGVVQQVRLQSTVQENVVTYTVVVDVANDGRLLPGMTATVDVVVAEAKDVFCVGTAGLRYRPDDGDIEATSEEMPRGPRLWVPTGTGKVRALPVTTGLSNGVCTEVSGEGVEAGLEVVTGVQREASEGLKSPFSGAQQGSSRSRGF